MFDHNAFEVESVDEDISTMWGEGVNITDEPFKLPSSGSMIAIIEDAEGVLV